MKVGFLCMSERGSIYPTFALAKTLKQRGHVVVYFGLEPFRADVERQGLQYVTAFPSTFSEDSIDHNPEPESLLERVRRARKAVQKNSNRADEATRSVLDGDLRKMLHEYGVEKLLIDPQYSWLIPHLVGGQYQLISFATELVAADRSKPQFYLNYIPRANSFFSKMVVRFLWRVDDLVRVLFRPYGWAVNRIILGIKTDSGLKRRIKIAEEECRLERIQSEYGRRWRLPEIVLCPRVFDFPHMESPELRRFCGPVIDFDRHDGDDFPWEQLPNESVPIVYVSLGTHAALYVGKTLPFLRCVLKLATMRQDIYFVVNIGKGRTVEEVGDVPPNMLCVQFCPQLKILQRAKLMMTNGGLGTLKECVYFRVPTIVLPCAWDQFSNAARIEFHGLGRRANIKRVTPELLSRMIEECLSSSEIRTNLDRMSRSFRDTQEFEETLAWLLNEPEKRLQ